MGAGPLRVVAVGQTPPPYGGQAIAIDSFVRGRYRHLEVFHVRMAFSTDFAEVGRFQPGKVVHLVALVLRILWCRVRTGAKVLYYPPAGPDLVPVLRDIVILLTTRWAFSDTVFHFHAGGLSEIYPRLPRALRPLFRAAYGRPDLTLHPSALNPPDGAFLSAARSVVVHNGVADTFPGRHADGRAQRVPTLLYVGVLRESKGVLVLVEACRLLRERGLDFRLHLMGQFESDAFEQELTGAVHDAGLDDRTVFLGTRTGSDKVRLMLASDIFCYPTHFESETFGLVLVEAMQFELPVVATRWRGVPTSVTDGENGFLVPIRDPGALAAKLQLLLSDPELARSMGRRGREIYLRRFTEDRFRETMERTLLSLEHPTGERDAA